MERPSKEFNDTDVIMGVAKVGGESLDITAHDFIEAIEAMGVICELN